MRRQEFLDDSLPQNIHVSVRPLCYDMIFKLVFRKRYNFLVIHRHYSAARVISCVRDKVHSVLHLIVEVHFSSYCPCS